MTDLVQRSLSGGEVSPSLATRQDVSKVEAGLRSCRNFVIDRQGAAQNRPGLAYVNAIPTAGPDASAPSGNERLIAYRPTDDEVYMLVLGDKWLRVLDGNDWVTVSGASDWADGTTYEVGDVVNDGAASSNTDVYYYCVQKNEAESGGTAARHNYPGTTKGDAFVWYPLPAEGESSSYLEIPTPYAAADLGDIQREKSGRVITLTHPDHAPMSFTYDADADRWTLQYNDWQPDIGRTFLTGTPTGGGSGNYTLRYKITARRKDTYEEGLPGQGTTAAGGGCLITAASIQSRTSDLIVENVAHGLATGDEVFFNEVSVVSDTRGIHEPTRRMLYNRSFRVEYIDADSFYLQDTAGLVPPHVLDEWPADDVAANYEMAYIEYTNASPPGTNAKVFEWSAVDGAADYCIYRLASKDASGDLTQSEYEFIDCVRSLTYRDTTPVPDSDPENIAPEDTIPCRYGTWPVGATYYQQRLWLAGGNDKPLRVAGSKVSDYGNFSSRSQVDDSDAVEFTIAGTDASEITQIQSLGQLIVMTSGSVHLAQGGADGVVSPGAINLVQVDNFGSKQIGGELVGPTLFYIQSRGYQVRRIGYDLERGGFAGYAGSDMTGYANHLFEGYQIERWSYQETPHSTIWIARDDGKALGLTYLPEQEILAWSRHDTRPESDKILDFETVGRVGYNDTYALTQRSIDGSTVYYIERLVQRTTGHYNTDRRNTALYLDCHSAQGPDTHAGATTLTLSTGGGDDAGWASGDSKTLTASVSPTFVSGDVGNGYRLISSAGDEVEVEVTAFTSDTVVTVTLLEDCPASLQGAASTTAWVKMYDGWSGLDHLEGETVAVVGDGGYVGTKTVASGAIDLDRPYGSVCIGFAVTSDIEPFDVDIVNADMAVSDKRKVVPSVSVMVEDTVGLLAGQDADNLVEYREKHGYEAPDLITGTIGFRFPSTPTDHGRILLRQNRGLPTKVLGFVRHVEYGTRID